MPRHLSISRPALTPRRRAFATLACAFAVGLTFANPHAALATQTHAYVVTTDYQTGGLSSITLSSRAVSPDVASVFRDARVRWFGGLVYVINRFGADNIQVIDPARSFETVHQFSVGNGANPSDIVVVSPARAYVSLYQRPEILIVNPTTGASLGSIDLRAYCDADGLPETDRLARFGRWILASVQRLDENHQFSPTDSSLVVVIDAAADTVVDVNPSLAGRQAIVLSRTNPVTPFAWDPDERKFYLGCAGQYGVTDGGVVRIDPETFTDLGVSITEAALGGDVSDVEWHTATHSYALISDANFNASLVTWNPTTGTRLQPLFSPGGFGLADCALNDRGELYLCDNSFGVPGVRVFSATTDLQIAGPLDTGLPPYEIAFDALRGDVASVPASTLAFDVAVAPNPARERMEFRIAVPSADALRLEIFDLAGRRLRRLVDRPVAGVRTIAWDLTAADGGRVAPGLYLARARFAGREVVRRVTVVP